MKKSVLTKTGLGSIIGVGVILPNIFSISCSEPPVPFPTSLTLTYSQMEYTFNYEQYFSTGIPTLKDNNNQDVTAKFSCIDVLPDGLDINEDTGEIFGTPTKAFEGEITISAIGSGEWIGINCTINLLFKIYTTSFVLTNGTVVKITNPDGLMQNQNSNYDRLNNTTYTSTPISDVNLISEIHISPSSITTAPDYYGAYLCFGMSNLTVADVNLPQGIMSVGEYFCYRMFSHCTSLITLPTGFNLPQSITSVGNNFCDSMFSQCSSLTTLPTSFNLPQSITTVGSDFCVQMFYDCTSLSLLPTSFNLPQSITSAGNQFCIYMLAGCTSLTTLPTGFNLPQWITSIGLYFCTCMFLGCSSLTTLPNGFNLPKSGWITTVGAGFCTNMFCGCTSLTTLPTGFNLPQEITSVGDSFCYGMFSECSSLTTLPTGFNLPQWASTVGSDFCSFMFSNCSRLGGYGVYGSRNFNAGTSAAGDYYASGMFTGATILLAQGVPDEPTALQLYSGYNIARS